MAIIRICSDLHTEFADYHFEKLPADKDTICILAGDIGVYPRPNNLVNPLGDVLRRASEQFKTVLYVVGNHEYYHGTFPDTRLKIGNMIKQLQLDNVHLLEDETHLEDGVMFIGATLWTYVAPQDCHAVSRCMNDFQIIAKQDGRLLRKFRPEDANIVHETSKHFIKQSAQLAQQNGHKVVVITHHGPSYQSVHERYKGDGVNCAFVSNLDELIMTIHPALWVHGHVHDPFDYMIEDTRIVANPRGYPNEQSRSGATVRHNPTLTVEL